MKIRKICKNCEHCFLDAKMFIGCKKNAWECTHNQRSYFQPTRKAIVKSNPDLYTFVENIEAWFNSYSSNLSAEAHSTLVELLCLVNRETGDELYNRLMKEENDT